MKKRISGTTAKGIPLINENNVADINQVNESLQKIDELLGDNQELNRHKNLSIINENGVHNLKYDPITKSFYYNQGGEWLAVELEGTGNVSVSGLTAGVLKTGVTAIVKQGEKEVKRVTGTFTSDATATANHIAPGRTAYVNGNKLTGTFTSDANAIASDIASGKTAYVNGNKITGTYSPPYVDPSYYYVVTFTACNDYVFALTCGKDYSVIPNSGARGSLSSGIKVNIKKSALIIANMNYSFTDVSGGGSSVIITIDGTQVTWGNFARAEVHNGSYIMIKGALGTSNIAWTWQLDLSITPR